MANSGSKGEQRRKTRGVIAGTGGQDSVLFFSRSAVCTSRKYGVEMRREQDDRPVWRCVGCLKFRQGVAFTVDMRIYQAKHGELLEEVLSASGFRKRRRGDRDGFQLPAADLRLMKVQPREGAMNGAVACKGGDAGIVGGAHSGLSAS